jgi:hypothetical protein
MHQNDRRVGERLDQPWADKTGNQGLGGHAADRNKDIRPIETLLTG